MTKTNDYPSSNKTNRRTTCLALFTKQITRELLHYLSNDHLTEVIKDDRQG